MVQGYIEAEHEQATWLEWYGDRDCQASKSFDKHDPDDDAGFVDVFRLLGLRRHLDAHQASALELIDARSSYF